MDPSKRDGTHGRLAHMTTPGEPSSVRSKPGEADGEVRLPPKTYFRELSQLEERLAWGPAYEDEHDFVFCRENGSPIWPRSFSRSFERHAKDAELPAIRFHDLRHTHATLALQAGVHPKVVSERLGHSGIGITLDTYSHAIPAMQEDAAAKVAALLE